MSIIMFYYPVFQIYQQHITAILYKLPSNAPNTLLTTSVCQPSEGCGS